MVKLEASQIKGYATYCVNLNVNYSVNYMKIFGPFIVLFSDMFEAGPSLNLHWYNKVENNFLMGVKFQKNRRVAPTIFKIKINAATFFKIGSQLHGPNGYLLAQISGLIFFFCSEYRGYHTKSPPPPRALWVT